MIPFASLDSASPRGPLMVVGHVMDNREWDEIREDHYLGFGGGGFG